MSALDIAQIAPFQLQDVLAPESETAGAVHNQLVRLMERYERSLYTYLLSLLRDQDAALDCAQDTFLRAYEHLRKGKTVNGNWLYTVARNRAVDEFRRKRRVQPELEMLEQMPVEHGSVDGAIDVQRIMDQLPTLDRDVLYLYEVAGFKTDEIGAILGVRGTAIRQRLHRARERFRQICNGAP